MGKFKSFGALCAFVAMPAFAQTAPSVAPIPQAPLLVAQPVQQPNVVMLPANTEVTLSMNDTISTKGKRWSEGDTFDMTVTHDVMLGNYVVIPRGARGQGRISWLTNKGAFGKSGKMEIDLEYVELGGRRIPISGHYKQEGEGNTVATVGTVVAAGLLAGFVTGKSGTIPQGRELTAHTKEDLPVTFAGLAPTMSAPTMAQPLPPVVGAPSSASAAKPANPAKEGLPAH